MLEKRHRELLKEHVQRNDMETIFLTTSIPRLMILKSKHFIQLSEIYTDLVLACGNANDVQ